MNGQKEKKVVVLGVLGVDAHVVGKSAVQMLSLTATGTPARRPSGLPRASAESISEARKSAAARFNER